MFDLAKEGKQAPGLHYGFDRVLHGEQYTEIARRWPTHGKLTHKIKIKDIFDKGKNALVVTAITTTDEQGNELAYNELTTFVRGAGGWGGDRGPSADVNVPPERAPDAVVEEKTSPNQALLYRLSGDWNPLHADPAFAEELRLRAAHPPRPLHLRLRRARTSSSKFAPRRRPAVLQEHQGALRRHGLPRRDARHRDVEGERHADRSSARR